jgi:hypothetical protein
VVHFTRIGIRLGPVVGHSHQLYKKQVGIIKGNVNRKILLKNFITDSLMTNGGAPCLLRYSLWALRHC